MSFAMGGAGVRTVSLALFVATWSVAAWLGDDPSILPAPWTVARLIASEGMSGELWVHLTATLLRVAAAFTLALLIGAAIGIALGRSSGLDRWLDPWLIVALNLPALVVIVLCYLWIGLSEAAAITAVALNKIPLVAVLMREGARALDPRLDDMGRVFAMPPVDRLRHVVLPQLAPHLASAARSGLALIWKIVLVVEFLGRPNGVGFQIHLHFQLFDVGMVLAYALAFVAVMLVIEALMQPWERHAARWRRT